MKTGSQVVRSIAETGVVSGASRRRERAAIFRTVVLGLCVVAALGRCGGSSAPTQPTPTAPPATVPTPTPTPTPGGGLPAGMSCNPTPPPLYGIKVKIHIPSADRKVLDSKPLVMNVDGYCARAGTGGETQKFCDTRPEGHPERTACDYLAVGRSPQTGRWGPTWTWDDKPCDGANFTSCANHQDNQFMVVAKVSADYRACAAPGAAVHPEGSSCGNLPVSVQ